MFQSDSSQAFLVISSTEYGAVLRRLKVTKDMAGGPKRWLTPCCDAPGCPWDQVLGKGDHQEWRAVEDTALCPSQGHDIAGALAIGLVRKGECVPLLQMAALRAFKTMTVPRMKKLVREFGMPADARRITNELSLCAVLVRHCLPDLFAGALQDVLELRSKQLDPELMSSILLQDSGICADMFDQDGAAEVGKIKQKGTKVGKRQHPQQQQQQPAPAAARASAPSASSSSGTTGLSEGGGVRKSRQFPGASDIVLSDARLYVPQVRGCSVTKDEKRHWRWKIQYPRSSPPYSNSCSYGGEVTEGLALQRVLLLGLERALLCHRGEARFSVGGLPSLMCP